MIYNEDKFKRLFSDDSDLRECKRKIEELLIEYGCELSVGGGILIKDKVSGEMYIIKDNQ